MTIFDIFNKLKEKSKLNGIKSCSEQKNQEKKLKLIKMGPTNGRMAALGDMLIVYVFKKKIEQRRLFI